jgi:hypothetical protein
MLDIEEFLGSGAFVETAQGPHFCQPGHKYVLVFGGRAYAVKAESVTVMDGRETVVFHPLDADVFLSPPLGIVQELESIKDIKEGS